MTTVSGVPANVPIPATVRAEGGEQDYRSALGFEGLLLDQLSKTLVNEAGLEDSPYADSMSGAFSASLLQGGGMGLADELYRSFALNGDATTMETP